MEAFRGLSRAGWGGGVDIDAWKAWEPIAASAGLSVEELPLIEWDEAARHVNGGGEKDELFLIELLSCFFTESGVRLRNLIAAALAYRSGETHIGPKTVETVIREEAHALKGSAANVRLLRVAKVSLCVGSK